MRMHRQHPKIWASSSLTIEVITTSAVEKIGALPRQATRRRRFFVVLAMVTMVVVIHVLRSHT